MMDFLFHNPIADMPGWLFICLAIVYCILIISGCKLWLDFLDPTRDRLIGTLDPHIKLEDADPYEVAYLRGGEKEVAITALFNLLQKGYLVEDGGKVGQSVEVERIDDLMPLEASVYEQFSTPRHIKSVISAPGMLKYLAPFCDAYSSNLIDKDLLRAPVMQQLAKSGISFFFWAMELPLGYKLLIALSKGKFNVLFLVVLLVIAPILFTSFCYVNRTTALGEKYLDKLKRTHIRRPQGGIGGNESGHGEAAMLVALYGTTALAGTSYAFVDTMLHPPSSVSSSTGNSSCSSSSCSSSSCSSSCSSCGGGGCGGCGGD